MAGYDTSDVLTNQNFGYRSAALASGVVSYNGFLFPPCLRSKVTVVPEYDDAQRTVKWLTIALSIEFIATDPGQDRPDSDTLPIDNTDRTTQDSFIHSLLHRLSQPCQKLVFTAQGFGEFQVGTTNQDVNFGPKPQVMEWEPLGGANAARIEWLCVTWLSPCLGTVPSPNLLQFQYAVDWNIDNAGFMTRNVEGSVEVPLNRVQSGSEEAGELLQLPQIGNYEGTGFNSTFRNLVFKSFPLLPGFKRQYFYRLRSNKKTVDFKIEDTEIHSNSRFLPGIADIEFFQNISTNLEDGWGNKWKLIFTGRVECVNAKKSSGTIEQAKKIAWLWIGKIIQQKRKVLSDISQQQTSQEALINKQSNKLWENKSWVDKNREQFASLSSSEPETGHAIIYPISLSVTDSLYGNTILFTLAYEIVIAARLIDKAVGLFEPVGIDIGITPQAWTNYIVKTKAHDESIKPHPATEFIIDLCHQPRALAEPVQTSNNTAHYRVDSQPIMHPDPPKKGQDWLAYHNEVTYYTKFNTVIGQKITEFNILTTDTVPEKLDGGTAKDDSGGEMDHVPYEVGDTRPESERVTAQADKKNQVESFSYSNDVCYVIMKGYASRYGGPINPPRLIGVGKGLNYNVQTGAVTIEPTQANGNKIGGAIASRTDHQKSKHWTRKVCVDSKGEPMVEYYCAWERRYVLDRVPTSGEINTTGNPLRFNQ